MRETHTEVLADPVADGPAEARPGPRRAVRRLGTANWIAIGLIALAAVLRLGLIAAGWPATNSDEGIIGLMARHIAYRGEHPIFFYGQNYMGPHQAFLGAALFKLFGSSLFVLRLGMVLLFVCFLASTYVFTRVIYGVRWALACLVLLAIGSAYILARELAAIGGYGEMLAFASLLFLLAAWLVLTNRPYRLLRECRWRLAVWAAWGVIAGTSLWSNLLIAPFVLTSGVVLVAFCWREVLRLMAPLAGLAGLVIGMIQLIYYNLHAKPGEDSLSTLQWVRGTPPSTLEAQVRAIWRSISVSVPMMTGLPVCQANELRVLGPLTSWSSGCRALRDTWGTGYMVLLVSAIALAVWAFWRAGRRIVGRGEVPAADRTQATLRLRKQGIHLALLLGAALNFWLYAVSNAPVDWPGIHGRYLIGFLIAAPAILWPLWQGAGAIRQRVGPLRRGLAVGCAAVLAGYTLVLAAGTVMAYGELPGVRAENRRNAALIDTLVRGGAHSLYSDYWSCAKLTFLSNERIVCGAVSPDLGAAMNRYEPYWGMVTTDPRAAYAFALGSDYVARQGDRYVIPSVEKRSRETGVTYRTVIAGGYLVYLAN